MKTKSQTFVYDYDEHARSDSSLTLIKCRPANLTSSVKMREFAGKNAGECGSLNFLGHAYNSINI